jgi:hypothetical protein
VSLKGDSFMKLMSTTADSPIKPPARPPVNLKVETGKTFDLRIQEVKINENDLKPKKHARI